MQNQASSTKVASNIEARDRNHVTMTWDRGKCCGIYRTKIRHPDGTRYVGSGNTPGEWLSTTIHVTNTSAMLPHGLGDSLRGAKEGSQVQLSLAIAEIRTTNVHHCTRICRHIPRFIRCESVPPIQPYLNYHQVLEAGALSLRF
jgi:hypothetical protein